MRGCAVNRTYFRSSDAGIFYTLSSEYAKRTSQLLMLEDALPRSKYYAPIQKTREGGFAVSDRV